MHFILFIIITFLSRPKKYIYITPVVYLDENGICRSLKSKKEFFIS